MKYRVFDGHCDTPVELWMRGESLRKNALAVSLEQAKHFGGYAQFFAFCTAWIENDLPHTEQYLRALDYFSVQLRGNADAIRKAPLPDGRGCGAGHVGRKDRRFPRYRGCGGHRL